MKSTKNRQISRLGKFLFIVLAVLPTQGRAAMTYYFTNITNLASPDVASQFSAVVTSVSEGVRFDIWNTGSIASKITEVYFDDGSLSELVGLIDSDDGAGGHPGVDFTRDFDLRTGTNPPNLPGWDTLDNPFQTTLHFSADADNNDYAVDPGEWLGIVFSLDSGQTYQDVIDDLNSGAIRIGLHVRGINGSDKSGDSFVNVVPLPASVLLGVLAVGLAGRKLRKFI